MSRRRDRKLERNRNDYSGLSPFEPPVVEEPCQDEPQVAEIPASDQGQSHEPWSFALCVRAAYSAFREAVFLDTHVWKPLWNDFSLNEVRQWLRLAKLSLESETPPPDLAASRAGRLFVETLKATWREHNPNG